MRCCSRIRLFQRLHVGFNRVTGVVAQNSAAEALRCDVGVGGRKAQGESLVQFDQRVRHNPQADSCRSRTRVKGDCARRPAGVGFEGVLIDIKVGCIGLAFLQQHRPVQCDGAAGVARAVQRVAEGSGASAAIERGRAFGLRQAVGGDLHLVVFHDTVRHCGASNVAAVARGVFEQHIESAVTGQHRVGTGAQGDGLCLRALTSAAAYSIKMHQAGGQNATREISAGGAAVAAAALADHAEVQVAGLTQIAHARYRVRAGDCAGVAFGQVRMVNGDADAHVIIHDGPLGHAVAGQAVAAAQRRFAQLQCKGFVALVAAICRDFERDGGRCLARGKGHGAGGGDKIIGAALGAALFGQACQLPRDGLRRGGSLAGDGVVDKSVGAIAFDAGLGGGIEADQIVVVGDGEHAGALGFLDRRALAAGGEFQLHGLVGFKQVVANNRDPDGGRVSAVGKVDRALLQVLLDGGILHGQRVLAWCALHRHVVVQLHGAGARAVEVHVQQHIGFRGLCAGLVVVVPQEGLHGVGGVPCDGVERCAAAGDHKLVGHATLGGNKAHLDAAYRARIHRHVGHGHEGMGRECGVVVYTRHRFGDCAAVGQCAGDGEMAIAQVVGAGEGQLAGGAKCRLRFAKLHHATKARKWLLRDDGRANGANRHIEAATGLVCTRPKFNIEQLAEILLGDCRGVLANAVDGLDDRLAIRIQTGDSEILVGGVVAVFHSDGDARGRIKAKVAVGVARSLECNVRKTVAFAVEVLDVAVGRVGDRNAPNFRKQAVAGDGIGCEAFDRALYELP